MVVIVVTIVPHSSIPYYPKVSKCKPRTTSPNPRRLGGSAIGGVLEIWGRVTPISDTADPWIQKLQIQAKEPAKAVTLRAKTPQKQVLVYPEVRNPTCTDVDHMVLDSSLRYTSVGSNVQTVGAKIFCGRYEVEGSST